MLYTVTLLWFNEFQRGGTSVFDEPRPGAPKTATSEDNATKIHDFELTDRRLKIREIAESVGMSKKIFGHEKAVGAMSAAFAHSGQQTQPCEQSSV